MLPARRKEDSIEGPRQAFPLAKLVHLGAVGGPAAVRIVSEFRFGVSSGAARMPMLRLWGAALLKGPAERTELTVSRA
jgi:hypothetical protein